MRNKRFPKYPDDVDYTTNSTSYYDDLARKQKLIEMLAKKIWEYEETLDLTLEEISNRLESYIEENDNLMTDRLDQWDLNLEKFPENVELLLQEWLSDGTLDHIINDTIFNWKADKTYVDSEIERLDLKDENITTQLAHIHYDVINEGAVGDGVTDDTLAIQNVLDKMSAGESIYFPEGEYRTTSPIDVTKPIEIKMLGVIVADHSEQAIIVKDNSPNGSFHPNYHNNIKFDGNIRVNRTKNKLYELDENAIGIELWNVFSGRFYLEDIHNHNVGVKLIGDKYGSGYAGLTYCNITLGVLNSYRKNIELLALNGWVTQNQFYSGSLTGANNDVETIHVDFRNEGTSVINENTFFGTSFEGGFKKAIKGLKSSNNKFISCRYEMPNLTHLFDFKDSRGNEFTSSTYVGDHMYRNLFNENEQRPDYRTNTKVVYYDYRFGSIEYYDRIFYIKPNKNHLGRDDYTVNSVSQEKPDEWDVRIVTQGLGYNRINTSNTNTVNNIFSVDLMSDFINVVELSEHVFTTIEFSNSPNFSKEVIINVGVSGGKKITLSVDDSYNKIIDKTGLGLSHATSGTFVKLLYSYYNNNVYVLEYI